MSELLSSLGTYIVLAVTAMTVENAVLGRALGVSRLISLVDDTTDTFVFTILMVFVMGGSGALFYFVNSRYLRELPNSDALMPLAGMLCIALVFVVVFLIAAKFMPYRLSGKAVAAAPAAAFNVTVLGTLMLTASARMSLPRTLVFCVGSAFGFTLAVLLVTEGQRKLQNRDIPAPFRGLPATLLYLAGLAMAVYALAGHTLSL